MPKDMSLKSEISALRKELKATRSRLSKSEKNQAALSKRLSALEKNDTFSEISIKKDTSKSNSKNKKDSNSTAGIILIGIGGVLCLTIIGAILGIPLLITGLILVFNKRKKHASKEISAGHEKDTTKATQTSKKNSKQVKTPLTSKKSTSSLEADLGAKWFARIGIVALVIGVGFFIKYAIDMNWITYLTRIILSVIFGVSLIVFGQYVSKLEKYRRWAKTLVGGGFAITYFGIYAAYYFEEYRQAIGISLPAEIFLLTIVVACSIYFSLKDNSQIIAAESFFLGYITLLLGDMFGFITLVYSLLLTVGLIVVVSYKKWPLIGIGGILGSYFMYILWNEKLYAFEGFSFAYASILLLSYFIAFSVQSFYLKDSKEYTGKTLIMLLSNSLLFFILYYNELKDSYPEYVGFFAFALAVIYLRGSSALRKKHGLKSLLGAKSKDLSRNKSNKLIKHKENYFVTSHLYLGIFYATLGLLLYVNAQFVTIIWAIEAVILMLLFLKTKIKSLEISAYAVSVFAFLKTLFYDSFTLGELDVIAFSQSMRLFSFLATIICFFVIYDLLLKHKKELLENRDVVTSLYSWTSLGLLLLIIFVELHDNYSAWVSILYATIMLTYMLISNLRIRDITYQLLAISSLLFIRIVYYDLPNLKSSYLTSIDVEIFAVLIPAVLFYVIGWYGTQRKDLFDQSKFAVSQVYAYAGAFLLFSFILQTMEGHAISVSWTILALILIMCGFVFGRKDLRIQGIIIFIITILKVFLYDTRNLETIYRMVSYMVLGGILLLVSLLYTKYKEKLKEIL